MAWNEPGGGRDHDPWGGRKKDDGPPDLDELIRKLQAKFGGLFGGKRGGGSSGGGGGGGGGGPSMPFGVGALAVVAVVVWLLSGIYIIDSADQGVVLRFGKYQQTVGPGPHWHLPYPVETVYKVNIGKVRTSAPVQTQMLTEGENLIRIELSAQFQVSNAKEYLFNVADPDHTLNEATESALRDVVGSMGMDGILVAPSGRRVLVTKTQEQIQHILDLYHTGLRVTNVNLENAKAPEEVRKAFEDAINAREDEARYKNQAEATANSIVPQAQGQAQSILQQAQAYKQQVVELAKGQASRFLETLAAYKKAPSITRDRLYLDTMQSVLSKSSKVLIKVPHGNNIMYLPLDQLLRGAKAAPAQESNAGASSQTQAGSLGGQGADQSDGSLPRPLGRREREGR